MLPPYSSYTRNCWSRPPVLPDLGSVWDSPAPPGALLLAPGKLPRPLRDFPHLEERDVELLPNADLPD